MKTPIALRGSYVAFALVAVLGLGEALPKLDAQCVSSSFSPADLVPGETFLNGFSAAGDIVLATTPYIWPQIEDDALYVFRYSGGSWQVEAVLPGGGEYASIDNVRAYSGESLVFTDLHWFGGEDETRWFVHDGASWVEVYSIFQDFDVHEIVVAGDSLVEVGLTGGLAVVEYDRALGQLSTTPLIIGSLDLVFYDEVIAGEQRVLMYDQDELTSFVKSGDNWYLESVSSQFPGASGFRLTPSGDRMVLGQIAYRHDYPNEWQPVFDFGGTPSFDRNDNAWVGTTYYEFNGSTWSEVGQMTPADLPAGVPFSSFGDPAVHRKLVVGGASDTIYQYSLTCGPAAQQAEFIRGDCNGVGGIQVADVVTILNAIFNGNEPTCADACDVDDSGSLSIVDPIRLLLVLFESGAPPAAPFPGCGYDVSDDGLECPASFSCP